MLGKSPLKCLLATRLGPSRMDNRNGSLLRMNKKVTSLSRGIMNQTLDAIFDGKVFRLDGPVQLEPNTRVRITIETVVTSAKKSESFLSVAQSLNLEGPPDWSSRLGSMR
jgi:hypothetical protein